MNDLELEAMLDKASRVERKITRRVLELICMAEDRRLYAKRGYSSLHRWLVERFRYSDSAAGRRIQAARLLRNVSRVGEKLESGDVNLSTLSVAQRAIREHEKNCREKLASDQRAEVVRQIENKSVPETEAKLMEMFPDVELTVRHDHKSLVNPDTVRISANFPKAVVEQIEQIGGFAEAVTFLLNHYLKTQSLTAAKKRRDKFQERGCEYRDAISGKVCGARVQLEKDHVVPVALGGSDEPENLRCLCKTHNLLEANEKLGAMADYRGESTRSLQLKAANRLEQFRAEFLKLAGRSDLTH